MAYVEVPLDPVPQPPALALPSGSVTLIPKGSATLGPGRAAVHPTRLVIDDDDLIEIELEGGVRLWTSGAGLVHDTTPLPQRGQDLPDRPIDLQRLYVRETQTRALASLTIKVLKVFGVDPVGNITDFVKDKVENQLAPGPGLYRCTSNESEPLVPLGRLNGAGADAPYLILLHGTASTTPVGFGGLWSGGTGSKMSSLLRAYPDQVLALQHRTLTESPIQNALALAEALPKSARLHLVSHSRGGLIGELLCRGTSESGPAFDLIDKDLFKGKNREADLDSLDRLGTVLSTNHLKVERFVRVACPALGTTLADRRLDRYLSVMVNLLERTGLGSNPVFDIVSTLLVGVIRNRTRPENLPGLEAMMPDSPLIAMLNRRNRAYNSDLHILAGDLEGSGLFGKLKELATDLFYREDHDLIVNTPAMFGGVQRVKPVRYWVDQGHNVSHFNYFRNAPTADRMMSALTAPGGVDFHTLGQPLGKSATPIYKLRSTNHRPAVFVLPGIMGTEMTVNGNRIWLDADQIAGGNIAHLKIDGANVQPSVLIQRSYGALMDYLAQTHDVEEFPYDWRKSVFDAATELNLAIGKKLDETKGAQPIRVLAHSMGGLVFKAMLASEEGKATWARACKNPGSRVVMLGTPSQGSHSTAVMLMGRDQVVSRIALLDIKNSYSSLLAIIAGFPGLLDLLPAPGLHDLFVAATWADLHAADNSLPRGWLGTEEDLDEDADVEWKAPAEDLLNAAKDRRALLDAVTLDPATSIYVTGRAPATPIGFEITGTNPARVRVMATARGDGRVPWATGIPPEVSRVWAMDAMHGNMTNTRAFFPAIADLVSTGTTTLLPASTPALVRGGADVPFEMHLRAPEMFPNEADLTAAALGGTAEPEVPPTPKVSVRVVHGDLRQARSPVLAGHYEGDSIVSAERHLDRVLQGRLTERHQLELYPGLTGTAQVFLNEGDDCGPGRHPGAIIVGLDKVGEITPGKLLSATARGALSYAVRLKERQTQEGCGEGELPAEINAEITSLLIGSGGGGMTVADSIQSIMRGVLGANRRLDALYGRDAEDGAAAGNSSRVRITKLEFRELYEDVAIRAARELQELATASEFSDHFEVGSVLESSIGGVRRATFEEDASWWRRLRITVTEDGSIAFSALSERARSDSFLQATQKGIVDDFLRQAQGSTATDLDLSHTLFELLLPNTLKDQARERRNLLLQLDDQSAAYPWELLQDAGNENAPPLSVQAGMVRQLDVHNFRANITTARGNNVLVVGDPHNEDKRFPMLTGARREAERVVEILTRHPQPLSVFSLIGSEATSSSVLKTLYARPYRIIHVAAHGVFEFDPNAVKTDPNCPPKPEDPNGPRKVSGVALGGGTFLTAAEIEQMRQVPDLVFLNCCHLSQAKGEYVARHHALAANLSIQLIRMGVRAVIAAGWEVADDAAETFASVFYEEFLGGATFGEAVQRAREKTHRDHQESNTWGAYQCYGDPAYTWVRKDLSTFYGLRTDQVSLREVLVDLENLDAVDFTDTQRAAEELKLKELLERATPDWLLSAALQGALAKAYGNLKSYDKAVAYCEEALKLHPAKVNLDLIERLVEYRIKLAESIIESANENSEDRVRMVPPEAGKVFDRAGALADLLLVVAKTPERLRVTAELHRCRALVDDGNRIKSLDKMNEAYADMFEILVEQKGDVQARGDALLNQLGAQALLLILGKPSEEMQKEFDAGLERLAALSGDQLIVDSFQQEWLAAAGPTLKFVVKKVRAPAVPKSLKSKLQGARRDDVAAAYEWIRYITRIRPELQDRLKPWLTALAPTM